MTGSRGVHDRQIDAVFQRVEHRCHQPARIERNSLSRLKIHLHAVLVLQILHAFFQLIKVVAVFSDVVSSAEVEPLHFAEIPAELFLYVRNRPFKHISTLLAHRMEMQALDTVKLALLEIIERDAQPRARKARIVNIGLYLRIFGVAAQSAGYFPSAVPDRITVLFPLRKAVEHDVVCDLHKLAHVLIGVSGAVNMHLAFKLFPA